MPIDGSLPNFGSTANLWRDGLSLVGRSKLKFVHFGPIRHPDFGAW